MFQTNLLTIFRLHFPSFHSFVATVTAIPRTSSMVIVVVAIVVTPVLRRATGFCWFFRARCTAEIRQLRVVPNKALQTGFAGETTSFERFHSTGTVAVQKREYQKLCMLVGRGSNVAESKQIAL